MLAAIIGVWIVPDQPCGRASVVSQDANRAKVIWVFVGNYTAKKAKLQKKASEIPNMERRSTDI